MSSLPQPLVAYPPPALAHPSSRSKGSFGPVFIVLAVITVVAVIACVISRLCARRLCQPKPPPPPVGRTHVVRDIEHGFGMDFTTAKPAAERDGKIKAGSNNKIHQEMRGSRWDDKLHAANFEAKSSK